AREIDCLTAAELYLIDLLDCPIVQLVRPCFPKVLPTHVEWVQQLWEYGLASAHLAAKSQSEPEYTNQEIQSTASRIYALEMQRIIGALFPLGHAFWRIFYQRQEQVEDKPLLALDSLYHLSDQESQIPYQLLLQSTKLLLHAQGRAQAERQAAYRNAQRLIVRLPLPDFQHWLKAQREDS
ncbi:MAG: hypothetical protein AAFV80_20790, partial [Bacteroidota bacterium]